MTKARLRDIKAASRANSAHQQAINELLATVEELQARTRRGEDISQPPEELPLAAKVNTKKSARGTQEEILAYAAELNLTTNDAIWFFEKMDENEWKVGNQPVKSWKGRMRTWKAGFFFPSQKVYATDGPKPPTGPARCTL
jgi:hypothetical protein